MFGGLWTRGLRIETDKPRVCFKLHLHFSILCSLFWMCAVFLPSSSLSYWGKTWVGRSTCECVCHLEMKNVCLIGQSFFSWCWYWRRANVADINNHLKATLCNLNLSWMVVMCESTCSLTRLELSKACRKFSHVSSVSSQFQFFIAPCWCS